MAGVVLSTILDRIQAELDDPQGQRFTDNYILRFLDQCNEDLTVEFASLGIDYGEQVWVSSTITAGAANLDAFMGNEGPLAFMLLPISLEWKHVGEADIAFRKPAIPRVDKVEDVQNIDGVASWEFRAQQSIVISPSITDVILRLRFVGAPAISLNDAAKTIPRAFGNVFVYQVASKIASRNAASGENQLADDIKIDLHNAKQNLQTLLTKQDQAVLRKFGRYNRYQNGSLMYRIPVL